MGWRWGTPPPPKRTWDQWKYYGMEMGYIYPPPPHVDKHTPVKTVPSRRTTYAGGNNHNFPTLTLLNTRLFRSRILSVYYCLVYSFLSPRRQLFIQLYAVLTVYVKLLVVQNM